MCGQGARDTQPLQETPTPETLAVEAGLAAAAAAGLVGLEGKPRGGKASDLVEVRESSVHGLGLYAAAPIPEGTVIGIPRMRVLYPSPPFNLNAASRSRPNLEHQPLPVQ